MISKTTTNLLPIKPETSKDKLTSLAGLMVAEELGRAALDQAPVRTANGSDPVSGGKHTTGCSDRIR